MSSDPQTTNMRAALEHIASLNRQGMAARMPRAELVLEADAAARAGMVVWETRNRWEGRWLTDIGWKELQNV